MEIKPNWKKKVSSKTYNQFFTVDKDVDPNKEHGSYTVGMNQVGLKSIEDFESWARLLSVRRPLLIHTLYHNY